MESERLDPAFAERQQLTLRRHIMKADGLFRTCLSSCLAKDRSARSWASSLK